MMPPDRSLSEAKAAGRPGIREIPISSAQRSAYVNDTVYDKMLTAETSQIRISISQQTARLYAGNRLALETPISTGRSAHPSPRGHYTILEKQRTYRSNIYGNYVNAAGEVVQKDISVKTDPIPEGAHFVGTSMPYWQRLTWSGIGMHIGYVPTYPASHGCLRFPSAVMPLIYAKTKIGTPVIVE